MKQLQQQQTTKNNKLQSSSINLPFKERKNDLLKETLQILAFYKVDDPLGEVDCYSKCGEYLFKKTK